MNKKGRSLYLWNLEEEIDSESLNDLSQAKGWSKNIPESRNSMGLGQERYAFIQQIPVDHKVVSLKRK